MEFLFSHLTSLMSPMPTGGTLMARKEFKDTPDFSRSTVLHFLTASLQGMTGTTALTMLSALGSVFFFFFIQERSVVAKIVTRPSSKRQVGIQGVLLQTPNRHGQG